LLAERRTSLDAGSLASLRKAQESWSSVPIADRLRIVRRVRGRIAELAGEFAQSVIRDPGDTLTAEVLPLCEACRFLEREAAKILHTYLPSNAARPLWLRNVSLEVLREPLGVVLVIGPSNYPLLLPGVHVLQALVAGNAVILKPGNNGSAAAHLFADSLFWAGLPRQLFCVLDEEPESARDAITAGVDKVVLTGSFQTGTAVLELLARSATPSIMELSGDDSLFVLEDGDPHLAAAAVDFALRLNGGNTCIAPKRVFAWAPFARCIEDQISLAGRSLPVHAFHTEDEAVAWASESPYGLGAAVFGSDRRARAFAEKLRVGVVVINDVIVPTADPRLPFGGRGRSGFGVTRGAMGLLEMTAVKAISVRRGTWRPHFAPKSSDDPDLFIAFIRSLHSYGWRNRIRGFKKLVSVAKERWRRS
jgi:aldehyde dehydrogenase (NAD+)